MNNLTYITTSIPYVNAKPHLGFALELVQADVIARYNRLIGRQVIFQTGTDENAFKNVIAAVEKGIPSKAFVDQNAAEFQRLIQALNISPDVFIRTTESRHTTGVQEFWKSLRPKDVYRTSYKGLYCIGCEDFYQEKDLVNGLCPDHLTKPVEIEEKNYFFRLSAYQKKIEDLIQQEVIAIIPKSKKKEILAFVQRGLQDISISRNASRANGWGIPVPGDSSQVIYVWLDALINYLTGQGFGTTDHWKDIWNKETRKIHVIGKNVWKFHAIYWPAFLLSAGLPLPMK